MRKFKYKKKKILSKKAFHKILRKIKQTLEIWKD